jgi:hypothetical protein
LERGETPVSLLVCEALRRHDTALAKTALTAIAASDPDQAVQRRAQTLLEGFEPSTTEWSGGASIPPPPSVSSSSAGAPVSSPRPRRVRPAAVGSSDVVVAKDPKP